MKTRVVNHLIDFETHGYINDETNMKTKKNNLLDCSLGVNPYGFSKDVIQKFNSHSLDMISNYPDHGYRGLKKAIAAYWKNIISLEEKQIILGAGSIGILNLINKLLIDKDTFVLGFCPQFTGYISNVKSYGGKYEYLSLTAETNFKFSANKLIELMNEKHKIVYIDNPNNPTGQTIDLADIERIVAIAENMGIYVIIDEAYGDFMEKQNSSISLVSKYSNLFVTRTFSKGFGLAGLRVGYMVCSEDLVPEYSKVDIPFAVNYLGQQIIYDALKDNYFMDYSIRLVNKSKASLVNACKKLTVYETDLNVPIMVLKHPDNDINLYHLFQEYNVETVSGEGFYNLQKNCVRMRVPAEYDQLLKVIQMIEDDKNV